MTFAAIEAEIDQLTDGFGRFLAARAALRSDNPSAAEIGPWAAAVLMRNGEAILEQWVRARGQEPTTDRREGFRLLALHAQGARGEPSFNACRETCRELVWRFNLITGEPAHPEGQQRLAMMGFVVRHLLLFVSGKMQAQGLGEFCCAARPVRGSDG